MPPSLLLGVIADDYTGATDVASMLREAGVRTGLLFGPAAGEGEELGDYQALVIALKTRSSPVEQAVGDSLRALARLRSLGAGQIYLKYCSTFDSTPQGNIGPVVDALLDALGADFTFCVPALPVNGRTQYMGYLFVGDRLLSESHMRFHPVTPMTESELARVLRPQARRAVGLIAYPAVRAGAATVRAEAERLQGEGVGMALVDALTDDDLLVIAEAGADLPLITGSSGLGRTLPEVWRSRGLLPAGEPPDPQRSHAGAADGALVLAGSCSAATLGQVEALQRFGEGLRLDPLRLVEDEEGEVARIAAEAAERVGERRWALVYSSAPATEREALLREAAAQGLSPAHICHRLERATGEIARRVVLGGGVGSVVVAGGETTGAVTDALGLHALEIGPALDPGVPAARSLGERALNVAFKSGNFGGPDFFLRALRHFGVDADREGS